MPRAVAFTVFSLFFLALPVHGPAATGPIRNPGPPLVVRGSWFVVWY